MASDGSLKFDTKIDESGFKKGMSGLQKTGSTAVKGIVTATKVASAAVLGIGIASVKVGSNFEAGMSQVASTMGITVDEINNGSESFEMLSKAAKDMGKTTMFSATESAEALNYLALAGYDAEDSVSMLPKVLNLASAGGLDLAYASDMVTDSMSALGLNIDQADEYIDQMAKTSQKSNTDVAQLGEAILTVGANAKDLKGGTAELNTAIGLLGNVGLKGAEAGTKLRNVIRSISTPTDKAKVALGQLGVETYDASGELKGMDEIMGDLNKSMEGMTTQEKKEMISQIFNPADMGAALTLLAATSGNVDDLAMAMGELGVPIENVDIGMDELVSTMGDFESEADFASYAMDAFGFTAEESGIAYGVLKDSLEDGTAWDHLEEQIRDSEGAAQDMSDTLNDNLKGDIEILKSALEGVGIALYENMDTPLRDVTQGISEYISEIGDAIDESDSFGEAMEVVAEITGTMLLEAIQGMAEAIPQVLEIAQLFIQTFLEGILENKGALIGAFIDIVDSILELFTELLPLFLDTGMQLLTEIMSGMAEAMPEFVGMIQEMIENIFITLEENLPLLMESGFLMITSIIEGIIETLPMIIEMGLNLVLTLAEAMVENIPLMIDTAMSIMESFFNGIIEMLPELLEVALELILTIVDGLIDNIDYLVDAALQIIESLVEFMLNNLPQIIDAALEIMLAIMDGLLNNIDLIIDATITIMVALIEAVITMLPQIMNSAIQIIISLVNGLLNNMPQVVSAIIQIITSLIGAVVRMLPQIIALGLQLIGELAIGLLKATATVVNAGRNVIKSIFSAMGAALSGAAQIGSDLVKGIWNGISDVTGWIMGKIKGFGESVMSGIKGIFGIKSPSQLMRDEVGKNLVLGIGVGFEAETPDLQRSINKDLSGLTAEMQATVDAEVSQSGTRLASGGVHKAQQASHDKDENKYKDSKMLRMLKEIRDKDQDIYMGKEKVGGILDGEQGRRTSMERRGLAFE